MRHASLPTAESRKIDRSGLELVGPAVLHVVSGEVALASGDPVLRLAEGDLLAVAPLATARPVARLRSAETLLCRIGAGWAEQALDLAGFGPALSPDSCRVERAGTDEARLALRLLRELERPARSNEPSARLGHAGRAFDLLALVLGQRPRATGRRPRPQALQSRRAAFLAAVEALADGSLDDVSLARLASELGVSERQVSRLFRDELGKTFREHVVELRVERARRLLRDTDRSVLEVAGETGWSSLAHFNAVFRRRVGVTPSAFRSAASQPRVPAGAGAAFPSGSTRPESPR